jgi:hypothetical protein
LTCFCINRNCLSSHRVLSPPPAATWSRMLVASGPHSRFCITATDVNTVGLSEEKFAALEYLVSLISFSDGRYFLPTWPTSLQESTCGRLSTSDLAPNEWIYLLECVLERVQFSEALHESGREITQLAPVRPAQLPSKIQLSEFPQLQL